jgi:L-asparagine oxygenase
MAAMVTDSAPRPGPPGVPDPGPARPSGHLELTPGEARATAGLAQELARRFPAADDEELLDELPLLAAGLPARPRRFLRRFGLGELPGSCTIAGHLVDEARIGPTPAHWKDEQRPHGELPEEILLLLYAALLGEPFGWATQQNGHLVNDVCPVREYEDQLLGTGSKVALTLHTEDAFHPCRADYIGLASLRNPQGVPILVAEADPARLPERDVDVLFGARFSLIPDRSHLPENNSVAKTGDLARFENLERLVSERAPVAILSGARAEPALRFDATHMTPVPGDPDAARAYAALYAQLRDVTAPCPLRPGDVTFLDNHRVVHGRSTFGARYDGTDRWLKRINVTRDLRRSREYRRSRSNRLVG